MFDSKIEMPPVVLGPLQQEWLDALKSGKFKKGREALCRDNAYCCLGVACELFAERLHIAKIPFNDFMRYDGNIVSILAWERLGLFSRYGEIRGVAWRHMSLPSLAAVNDLSETFDPIIKIIETMSGHVFSHSV